jgi:hypothetical protein
MRSALEPEEFNYGGWNVYGKGFGLDPLRPEFIKRCVSLHKTTQGLPMTRKNDAQDHGGSGFLWAADDSLHAIHSHT